jgi:alkanesulfonate monooxygenase SsuD/methylene tetrahydromethanopterin reductase-like flavin-dependent oxidoreductase (luciferase family)
MPLLSVLLPPNRPPRELAQTARYIEAAGLDGVWVADHLRGEMHFVPPWYGMVASLATIACECSTLRFGPLVAGMPLRPAATLRIELATLEALAPGRLLAAIGSGSSSDAATTGLVRGTASELATYVAEVRSGGLEALVAGSVAGAIRTAAEVGSGWVTAGKRRGGVREGREEVALIQEVTASRQLYEAAGGAGPCLFLVDADEGSPWASAAAMTRTLELWGGIGFDEVVVFSPETYEAPSTLSYADAAELAR